MKLDLSKFNKSDIFQLQEKVLIIMGVYFGLCGDQEHCQLKSTHFSTGMYPTNHPMFPGLKYTALTVIPKEKKRQLSLNNAFVCKSDKELGRFPHFPGQPKIDVGGALYRYLQALPENTPEFKGACDQFYRSIEVNKVTNLPYFHCNLYLGKNYIRLQVQSAYDHLGINKGTWNHAMRSAFITRLTNDPSVSLKEVMRAAYHTSATASAIYMKHGNESESNRVSALLQGPVSGPVQDTSPAVKKPSVFQKLLTEDVSPEGKGVVTSGPRHSPVHVLEPSSASPISQSHFAVIQTPPDHSVSAMASLSGPETINESVPTNPYSVHTQYELEQHEREIVVLDNSPDKKIKKIRPPHSSFFSGQRLPSPPVNPRSCRVSFSPSVDCYYEHGNYYESRWGAVPMALGRYPPPLLILQ